MVPNQRLLFGVTGCNFEAKWYFSKCFVVNNLGPVAQRLEQGTHNPLVVGSNPTGPTILSHLTNYIEKVWVPFIARLPFESFKLKNLQEDWAKLGFTNNPS